MNKRHYEHTLPNIRGSLSNTYSDTKILLFLVFTTISAYYFTTYLYFSIVVSTTILKY